MNNQHIILVVIEALRPDHMSLYGYHRPTTPILQEIANQGTTFSQCITVAPRTWQSFTSLMTGVYPHRHGVRFVGDHNLDRSLGTLPRLLRQKGYRTLQLTRALDLDYGFDVANPRPITIRRLLNSWLSPGPDPLPKWLRHHRGVHNDVVMVDVTLQWLKQLDQPGFVLLRLFAPHWPYNRIPQELVDFYCRPGFSPLHARCNQADHRKELLLGQGLTDQDLSDAMGLYDACIAFADQQIHRLVSGLLALGIYDQSLLVITSDHGEGLGDHGYFFEHGDQLYEEALQVPLIFAGGGVTAGGWVDAQIQNLDIMPTILDFAGISVPANIDGNSLTDLIGGISTSGRDFTFAESGRNFHRVPWREIDGSNGYLRMVRTPEWKLIYTPRHFQHGFELYHLPSDPGELNNRFSEQPVIARKLQEQLEHWLLRGDDAKQDHSRLDQKVETRLRELGYLA